MEVNVLIYFVKATLKSSNISRIFLVSSFINFEFSDLQNIAPIKITHTNIPSSLLNPRRLGEENQIFLWSALRVPSCDGWEGKVFIVPHKEQIFRLQAFPNMRWMGDTSVSKFYRGDYSQNVLFAYRMFKACSALEALPARDYFDVNVRPCKLQIP